MRDFKRHPRFLSRLFCSLPLAAVAVVGFAAPPSLAAQQPTDQPSAEFRPETSPAAAPSQSGPSKEEQQVQAFRLEGPVVKWTARTLHISIETTATIYEVLNFLIIVLAVGVPLVRMLPRYLRTRKEKLRNDIESARKVTEDANARLTAVEAKLASLDAEIGKFRAEVEAESLQDEARIKATLGEESARIVEAASQEIAQAEAQARRGLRSFAADLAIDQAARQLVLTPETDRALIAEFVADLVGKGGQS